MIRSTFLRLQRTHGLRWALYGLAFALAYSQDPLFTSNQNQYFLHGLAWAGYGNLKADWLANTVDPTPLFSSLVRHSYLVAGSWVFYAEYGLMIAIYLASLLVIVRSVFSDESSLRRELALVTVLTVVHSAAIRYLLGRLPGDHWAYLLEAGVAGQRLLGPVFEPSVFGVLLVLSLALFLRGRPVWASVAASGAALVHPTYLLSAALLVGGYIVVLLWFEHRHAVAGVAAALALLTVSPSVIHTAQVFGSGSASVVSDAASVLVHFRIPHHAVISDWLDITVPIKAGFVLAGLWLIRRTRVFVPLAVLFTGGVVLSLIQALTSSDRLALLFPWRVSTVLVPIGVCLVAARSLAWGLPRLEKRLRSRERLLGYMSGSVLAALALAGIFAFGLQIRRLTADPAQPLYREVRSILAPDQTYFIPPKLQDFRLATGAPIFVDFKSIPYRGSDVLAWYERIRVAQFFYRDQVTDVDCGQLDRALAAGVTHVVLSRPQFGADCEGLHKLWGDSSFALYRIDR